MNVSKLHPSAKAHTATVPVNVDNPADGEDAIRETLADRGRTLVEGSTTVLRITDAVPASQAGITFPGSTRCFVFRFEYTVNAL